MDEQLIVSAIAAMEMAYAKYSNFCVGAALLCSNGAIFQGCNIENLSFGLTMCAERVAVGAAIASGQRQFVRMAIATRAAKPTVPCGACRQVLAEFNPGLKIVSATVGGAVANFSLAELLPIPDQGILDQRST